MSNTLLYTADNRPIKERSTEPLHPRETIVLVVLHKIAQRLGIGIHCSKCGQDFTGANTGHEKYFSIACGCRELKGDAPRGVTNF